MDHKVKYFPYSKEVDAGNGLSNVDTSGGFTMSVVGCFEVSDGFYPFSLTQTLEFFPLVVADTPHSRDCWFITGVFFPFRLPHRIH